MTNRVSIIQVTVKLRKGGKEMKKVVGVLRICVGKKWGGVGIKI